MNPKFGLSNERVLFFILYIFKSHASAENDSLCSIDQNSLHITYSQIDPFRFYPSTACFVQKGPSDTAATQHTNGHQMIYVSLQYHLQVKESIMEGTLFHRS